MDIPFSIIYGDKSGYTGSFFNDTFSIAGVNLGRTRLGLAQQSNATVQPGGVMGIGYEKGEAVVAYSKGEPYPNVVSKLQSEGFINSKAYSIWLNSQGMCILGFLQFFPWNQ